MFFLFTLSIYLSQALSQTLPTCSINPEFISSNELGFYPNSPINFLDGKIGIPYARSITIKANIDTIITVMGPVNFCITRYEVVSPAGVTNFNLPSGFNISGIPSNLKIPGGASGCAVIYGNPNTAGTYNLKFQLNIYGNASTSTCPTPPTNINSGLLLFSKQINHLTVKINP